jgi:hypothetical protein
MEYCLERTVAGPYCVELERIRVASSSRWEGRNVNVVACWGTLGGNCVTHLIGLLFCDGNQVRSFFCDMDMMAEKQEKDRKPAELKSKHIASILDRDKRGSGVNLGSLLDGLVGRRTRKAKV